MKNLKAGRALAAVGTLVCVALIIWADAWTSAGLALLGVAVSLSGEGARPRVCKECGAREGDGTEGCIETFPPKHAWAISTEGLAPWVDPSTVEKLIEPEPDTSSPWAADEAPIRVRIKAGSDAGAHDPADVLRALEEAAARTASGESSGSGEAAGVPYGFEVKPLDDAGPDTPMRAERTLAAIEAEKDTVAQGYSLAQQIEMESAPATIGDMRLLAGRVYARGQKDDDELLLSAGLALLFAADERERLESEGAPSTLENHGQPVDLEREHLRRRLAECERDVESYRRDLHRVGAERSANEDALVEFALKVQSATMEREAALADLADEKEVNAGMGRAIESLEAENLRLQGDVTRAVKRGDEALVEGDLLRSALFIPPVDAEPHARVLFLPSVSAAIAAGFNGFGYQLVGETFQQSLPRNPDKIPLIVRIERKGVVIDVEARLAPVAGGAS